MSDTGTILIVDDEVAIVELLVNVLAKVGYRTQMAFDGPTALASITRQMPALLLLDVRMPRMSGVMLLDQLREAGLLQMPVVLMTAALPDCPALRGAGVSAVLAKPFDFAALVACVAEAMSSPAQGEAGTTLLADGGAETPTLPTPATSRAMEHGPCGE